MSEPASGQGPDRAMHLASDHIHPKEVEQPTWKALDRATTEALVGRKLD